VIDKAFEDFSPSIVESDQHDAADTRVVGSKERAWERRLGPLLFALASLAFMFSPVLVLSDSNYSMLLSDSIIRHHSTHLNSYHFPSTIAHSAPCISPSPSDAIDPETYQLDQVKGNVVYCYPNATSLLSVPFVVLMEVFKVSPVTADGRPYIEGEALLQRLLASLLMAGLTVIIFRTARVLLDLRTSVFLAVGAAFGTQIWSTASRSLWAHTWLIFLGGVVVNLLLRAGAEKSKFRPVLLATLIAWMYFTRPTALIPLVCLTIYIATFHRSELAQYALTGLIWFAGFITYSWFTFGKLIPDYYLDARTTPNALPSVLPTLLFSPSRGLFIYVPILIFVFYLIVAYWKLVPYKNLALLALSIAILQLLLVGSWPVWWGGYSYGPRLLTDTIPWLCLLAILGLAARVNKGGVVTFTKTEAALALALLSLSIVLNARGAISPATRRWNLEVDIDRHPERALDWSYPQFAAGLVRRPKF
jgi:hypothetical protein